MTTPFLHKRIFDLLPNECTPKTLNKALGQRGIKKVDKPLVLKEFKDFGLDFELSRKKFKKITK